jgi:hypothetical protein
VTDQSEIAAVITAIAGEDEAGLIEMTSIIVGNEVHAILKAHAMKMPTVAAAIALGVNVAAQMLVETVLFADRSAEGGDDGETLKRAATAYFSDLVAQALPGHLRSVGNA